jgi:hypothetical protein
MDTSPDGRQRPVPGSAGNFQAAMCNLNNPSGISGIGFLHNFCCHWPDAIEKVVVGCLLKAHPEDRRARRKKDAMR